MSSGLRLGGLASGLDTDAIVSQLMAIERQPRMRIELKQAAAQARKDALSDINTKLKALKTAAANLSAASSWAPTQTVTSTDAAKVGARSVGAITPGTYDVTVTQLARAQERTFTTRTSIQTRNITITPISGAPIDVAIPAGSDIDEIVAHINANPDVPVVARNFNGQLLLQAKASGVANGFSASSFLLTSQVSQVSARDSQFTVNGVGFTRSSNTVSDVEPGLELTLGGLTSGTPVQVEVGSATVDAKALAGKMKAYVDAYNAMVDATRSRISEKRVLNPTTTTDAKKGVLFGDTSLTQMLSQLRNGVMDAVDVGNSSGFDELADIGLSTGSPTGGVSTPESIQGKLQFDETKFMAAFNTDPASVERLLRGTTTQAGFATRMDTMIQPLISAGGVMDGRILSSTNELTRLGSDLKRMDERLERKETYLRRQFTSLETALAQLNAQSSELSSRLAGLPSSSNS